MKINTRSIRKAGALLLITEAILFAMASSAQAQSGGVVAAGQATINQGGAYTTINQSSSNVIINWQSFNIATGQTVQFVQPGSNSVALNRVVGADPSAIMGTLTSNGIVFLLNPNGVLFGSGSSVSVGGLVASTMNITDANFMAGNYVFTNAGAGSVINQGNINVSDGGNVALMGRTVNNQGVISARLGSVNLVGAEAVTLDIAGDGLLNVSVSQGAVNALVQNGGLIQADGGRVLMTAQAAGNLLNTAVNNTGVIQARTIENRNGTILLLGDMQNGSVNVGGVLDASAPNGGNGGFIETSAAHVNIASAASITTAAANGNTGHWLIDPTDFVIGSAPGNNIAGSTLSAQLVTNNITINTASAGTQAGNITVNDAVTWSASGAPTTLTLIADGNVNINAAITATQGNLDVCCGQDINVNAAITATNGSVLLSAGNNINQSGAITVTDGNLSMCAANDVNIAGAITVTNGTNDPTRSLGLARGLTLRADSDGTGPGIAGGTVRFNSLAPPTTVTNAPVAVYYNPVSYTTPTVYTTNFTLTGGATLASYMLVFGAGGDRDFNGTTTTTLTGLIGNPAGVTLVAGPNASANFGSAAIGNNLPITYTGYTLSGPNASSYALALNCCGTVVAHTTGSITSPPPVVIPPVVVPPVVVPPGTIQPGSPPPGITPTTPVALMPGPIGSYVTVEEDTVPANTLEITVIEEVPYVAPVYAPVPYRN
ncbi:MAG: filamentous hemagglutinin N-terminal domain-containing protein [Arenimonas sp.]